MNSKLTGFLIVAVATAALLAQTPPPVIVTIDVENVVRV